MKVQAARMELSFHHPRAMAGRAVSGLGSLLNTEGEDIIARIQSFYEQAPDDFRIRSANGVISNAILGNAVSPVPMTFEGMCEILSLTGSFGANENGIVTVSLANKEGHVIGGRVVGEMMAATLVTVELCRLLQKVEPSDIPHICKSGIAGTNRSTAKGNWRTTGNDKEIYTD
ncbi:hypothetical protein P8452_45583 [Trifolium repens]|nr:hypothetical protein P8452_45583 [Trifolium repens]